ncbi:hypothetical protein HK102_010247 [Quaeritorhiza haematococci]|nr:hypothetical protein HK102_010247 [Quaeritorhiza haematococci]
MSEQTDQTLPLETKSADTVSVSSNNASTPEKPSLKEPQHPTISRKQLLPILVVPFIIGAMVLIVFSLYFGAWYKPDDYLSNLNVEVVSFDSPTALTTPSITVDIGGQFTKFVQGAQANGQTKLGWSFVNAGAVSREDMVKRCENGDVYGVVIVEAGASLRLASAINGTTDGSYNGADALTLVYDEGRNPNLILGQFLGRVRPVLSIFSQTFPLPLVGSLSQSLEVLSRVSQRSPQVLTSMLGFKELNLHPQLPLSPVGNIGTNIGLILQCVFAFAFVNALQGVTMPLQLNKSIRAPAFISGYLIIMVLGCALMSLMFSLVVFAYKGVSVSALATFWLLNWLQMSLYGITLSAFKDLVGMQVLPLMFFIFLVSNISFGFINLDLSDPFYRLAYIVPFWHAITATRTILYGSYNRLSINIPVLVAMMVISTTAFCLLATRRLRILRNASVFEGKSA